MTFVCQEAEVPNLLKGVKPAADTPLAQEEFSRSAGKLFFPTKKHTGLIPQITSLGFFKDIV